MLLKSRTMKLAQAKADLGYHQRQVKYYEEQVAKAEEQVALGTARRIECERMIDGDRQNRWQVMTPHQQAAILLAQLNKTMGLYKKPYDKLSREGLQWLANNGHVSQPLAGDLLNDEIPF